MPGCSVAVGGGVGGTAVTTGRFESPEEGVVTARVARAARVGVRARLELFDAKGLSGVNVRTRARTARARNANKPIFMKRAEFIGAIISFAKRCNKSKTFCASRAFH